MKLFGDALFATARQFIKEGAKVVVTGRSTRSVSDAQKELNVNGVAIVADVTKSADLDSLFKQVRGGYGREARPWPRLASTMTGRHVEQ